MNFLKENLGRIIGSIFIIGAMSLVLFSLTNMFKVKPDPFVSKFSIAASTETLVRSDSPEQSAGAQKDNSLRYEGRIDIHLTTTSDDLVAFVPSYTGYITLKSGGKILYESAANGSEFAPNRLQTAYFDLGPVYPQYIDYEMFIPDSTTGPASYIYIGPRESLEYYSVIYNIYKLELRSFYWSVEIFVICFMALLFLSRSLDRSYIPYFEAFLFLFLFHSPIALSGSISLFSLYPYIAFLCLPLMPVMIQIQSKVTLDIASLRVQRLKTIMYLCSCLLIVIDLTVPDFPLRNFNLFITFPLLLTCITFLAAWSYYDFIKCCNAKSFVFSLSMTFVAFAIGHDVSVRLGTIQSPILLSTLSTFSFFSTLSIITSSQILTSRKSLENHAIFAEKQISAMRAELQKVFEKTIKLKTAHAIQIENNRITRDLHDGVLTYLAMIKTLVEEQSDIKLQNIEKLSTNALLEIRAIIENDFSKENHILNMISTLRTQIEMSKEKDGVKIEWDILKLADQTVILQSHALNILRILQEALYNAMHRAHAKNIIVMVDWVQDQNTIIFTVQNTHGLAFSQRHEPGQGIQNMQRRAKLIGADFNLIGLEDGAIMQLIYTR